MKKVLAITCILVFCIAGMTMAADNNWRFGITTSNIVGDRSTLNQFGIGPTSLDTVEATDSQAAMAQDVSGDTAWTVGVIGTKTYSRDIMAYASTSSGAPNYVVKSWNLRVAAMADAGDPNSSTSWFSDVANGNVDNMDILVTFGFITQAQRAPYVLHNGVSPVTYPFGMPVRYRLTMVDNKAVAGAPVAGSSWIIQLPPSPLPYDAFWTWSVELPFLSISSPTDSAMIAEGYQMTLVQEERFPAPEPSGLIALGTGLIGFVGFMARRRRDA